MKKNFLMIAVATIMAFPLFAQNENDEPDVINEKNVYLGIGFGFDYGGIFGGKLEYLPTRHLGLFGSLGYNSLSLGWNMGVSYKFSPEAKVSPTICAFYGYNAVSKVENAAEYNMTSYGITFGGGVNVKLGENENILSINLFVPVRSKKFMDNYDAIKNDSRIKMETGLIPIGFSIGYNFCIK
jgi:hypothetical protein